MRLVASIPRTTVLAVASAMLLALGLLGPAYASVPVQQAGTSGHFGMITEVGQDDFSIEGRNGVETFLLTESTRVRIANEQASVEVLREDQRVAVTAQSGSDGVLAIQVMIIPSEPLGTHLRVTVVERTPQVLIARDRKGNEVRIESTVDLPEDADGDLVTLVADRSSRGAGGGAGGSILLRSETPVPASVLIDRLREQMAEARRNGDLQLASSLEARLRAAMEAQLTRLASTVEQLPEQARERVEAAITRNVEAFDRTLRESGVAVNDENAVEIQSASGVLDEVNERNGFIVIERRNGVVLRFLVNNATRVQINGGAASLGDLEAGDEVSLRYNVRTRTALQIAASTANVSTTATISSVDAAARTVSLRLRASEIRLRVTDSTRITINGIQASLPDLRPGTTAEVSYDSRSGEADSIAAQARIEATGMLSRVDTSTGELVVETDAGETLVLAVTPRSRVEVNGAGAALARLGHGGGGGRIAVYFDARTNEVLTLSARVHIEPSTPLLVRGMMSGEIAEHEGRTVVIREANGSTATLAITIDTRIVIGDRPGSPSELQAGRPIRATYDRNSQEALTLTIPVERAPGEQPRRAQVTGRIVAADTLSSTLTLFTDEARSMDLVLSPGTRVEIAGRPGSFSDLVRGARASVTYDPSSMVSLLVTLRSAEADDARPLPDISSERPATRTVTGRLVLAQGERLVVNTGSGSLTLALAPGVRVSIDGAAGSVDRLAPGMAVSAEVDTAGVVVAIQARSGASMGPDVTIRPGPQVEHRQISGSVGEVSAERRSLAVRTNTGSVAVSIGTDTRIAVDGTAVSLSSLEAGMTVIVYIASDGTATSIEAHSNRGSAGEDAISPERTSLDTRS